VYSVVADSVTSQNVRHYSAEASSDRLLGSAKPGLIEPTSCQKGLIVIKAKGVVMLNFVKKRTFLRSDNSATINDRKLAAEQF